MLKTNILRVFFLVCLVALPLHAAQKVAVIGLWPLTSVLAFWTDARLIYIPKASYNAMEHSLSNKYAPKYKEAKVGNSENLEELLSLKADLYICPKSNIKICNGLENAGARTVKLTTNVDKHNSKKVLQHWLDSLAPYFPIEQKNRDIINDITQTEDRILEATKDTKKPKGIVIHRMDKNIAAGIFADYLLQYSGAENALGYMQSGEVGMEEIYRMNPEIIYISNFTPLLPTDILESKAWQNIDAVKNGRVYKLPLATYRPFAPSLDISPVLLFMAQKNHPELFKDMDIGEIYRKHSKKFYGIDLNEEDINAILNPNPKAGILN
ncbi:MAG: ABC transporter substrate-binding protein [Helicobacter sp.]|nr:ABC transporter substrate-binding protein [Helicobacter sp.]